MQLITKIALILAFFLLMASCESAMDSGLINCTSDSDCGEGLICNNLTGECVEDSAGDTDGDMVPDGDGEITSDGDADASEGDESSESEDTCSSITTNPSELDFGCVVPGMSSNRELTITNISDDSALTVFSIYLDSSPNEFILDPEADLPNFPVTLETGESLTVSISFIPGTMDSKAGSMVISSNACDNPRLEIPLSANLDCCPSDVGISVTPQSHDFGNIRLGDSAVEQEFSICNKATANEENQFCALTVTQIASESGVWDSFKCITDTCVTPQIDPLRILPGEQNCESFTIMYSPQDMGEHGDTILVFNDSDTPGDRIYKVDINGSASESCIFLHPYPVDFGSVVVGETRERIATLHNYCENDVNINLISKLELEDDNCNMFSFGEDINAVQGSVLLANNVQPVEFTVKYTPTEVASHTCHIDIASSLEDAEHMQFPITGRAKDENEEPICLVSLNSHGSPMDQTLNDVQAGTDMCFYGNISYDPDTSQPTQPIKEYNWSVLEWPADSESVLMPAGDDGWRVCITFDVAGIYRFSLSATDEEDAECEPFIITVNVVGDQGLWLVMDFTAGSPSLTTYSIVDCDLGLRYQSTGEVCDDEHANDYGTCYAMQNADCNMPKISHGAYGSGTKEEINCSRLADGNWIIEAELEEDCESNSNWQTLDKCYGTHDSTVTIKMYDPNDYSYDPLFPPVSTVLTYKEDKKTWLMRKSNGVWQDAPVETE